MEWNLKLNPEKPIYHHLLFWLAVLVPAGIALLLSFPVMPALSAYAFHQSVTLNLLGYLSFLCGCCLGQ